MNYNCEGRSVKNTDVIEQLDKLVVYYLNLHFNERNCPRETLFATGMLLL